MKCEIISVGTELLLGNIINTNSKYISERLADLGFDVNYHITVGDNEGRLVDAGKISFERSELLIFTGGLGPTDDDITRETVAKLMGLTIRNDEVILSKIKGFYDRLNRSMPDINKKQANVPEGAIVLDNPNGTAPGLILTKDGKYAVLLPGPPKEMVPMFEDKVVPWLRKIGSNTVIESKTLRIVGVGESSVQEQLQHIFDKQTNPTVAPYAKTSETHLRVTAKASSKEEAHKMILPVVKKIEEILGDNIYGYDNNTLEMVILDLAKKKNLFISTAESCTGGLIANRITDVSGSSEVFLGSVVSYSNEMKINILGVKEETIKNHGAVSSETAAEMAEGIRKITGSNIGISTTGIAGPGGGSAEKPVGLAYIGIATDKGTKTFKTFAMGNREKIKWNVSTKALDILRREMLKLM